MAKKQLDTGMLHMSCERALDEWRRQNGMVFQHANKKTGLLPAEFLTEPMLAALRKKRAVSLSLLLSAARAKSLGMAGKSSMALAIDTLSLEQIRALADPTYSAPLPKKFTQAKPKVANAGDHLLALAKRAALLPALLVIENYAPKEWLGISSAALTHYMKHPRVEAIETAQATLPIHGAENTRILSFRTQGSTAVHLALIVGDIASIASPLTRIHSSCVTGDILGSLRCDCGDQLKLAMERIIVEGSGILLYLHQEGRGIGITNKIRAYQLQEQGIDTYEANRLLGFDDDERDFAVASAMLRHLGIKSVRLLTNNPSKMEALRLQGVRIEKRLPLITQGGAHNRAYLHAKGKAGHQL